MGSIRPLFTITVLVVVGAYLYVKINEGPVRQHSHSQDGHDHADDGVPPLVSTSGGATLAQDTGAPAWPAVDTKNSGAPPLASTPAIPSANGAAPAAPATIGTPADIGQVKNALPEVPPIPELPELPQISDAAPPSAPPAAGAATTPPLEMPQNVPTAQYDNAAGPNLGGGAATNETPGAWPVLPQLPGETTNPAAPPGPSAIAPVPSTGPAPSATNPLRDPMNGNSAANVPAPPTPAARDRYGMPLPIPGASAAPTTPAMPAAESTSPGTPMIPAIPAGVQIPDRYGVGAGVGRAAVTRGNSIVGPAELTRGRDVCRELVGDSGGAEKRDLKQAHQLLSKWHGDATLSPADSQKVEMLLGQLAGTVIYSTEHQLEPARTVKPGETLETIAKEYDVPWQLLAKINGVPAPEQLRPGQELKVVRGPFSAVVDLQRSEMTLEVGGCYAGTFPITPPADAAVTDGQWLVEQKLGRDAVPAAASAPPATPYRRIILRNASAGATTTAATLMIDGDSGSRPSQPGAIRVAMQDAEDLSDILSVGSRITVRR